MGAGTELAQAADGQGSDQRGVREDKERYLGGGSQRVWQDEAIWRHVSKLCHLCKDDEAMIKYEGYDEAILGPAFIWRDRQQVQVLVYDAEKIVEILMRDGIDAEEAREYIEFNIEGGYLGVTTPVLVWSQDFWDDEEWMDL